MTLNAESIHRKWQRVIQHSLLVPKSKISFGVNPFLLFSLIIFFSRTSLKLEKEEPCSGHLSRKPNEACY